MPKLWEETIEAHRRAVRDAILDTTSALAAEHGLLSVTMSRIAGSAGVGRATLYKYFPDIEAVLVAWHERQTTAHLEHLSRLAASGGDPRERLRAVLEAYAAICHHRGGHSTELVALLHQGDTVGQVQQQLVDLVRDLVAEAVEAGQVRDDIGPGELANYCIHALAAAGSAPSNAAVDRLVEVTLAGLGALD